MDKEAFFRGKRVLVTGAAGSIGSALCRRLDPASLLAVDLAEMDIRDEAAVQTCFNSFRPDIVFHAAALKDVPELESRVRDAVLTNVFGTLHVARAARDFGAQKTILLSTDKAVRPASVMGATKRIAELIFQSLTEKYPGFITVRLGNVLGTQRSVLPKFLSQVANGGPVTVTHPEMRRYFLDMPRAVEVLLTAAAAGQGGEIFVPEMGPPVSIVELAKSLINGHPDVRIEFTGIRPGEKLTEQLWDDACEVPVAGCHGLNEYRPRIKTTQ